MTRAPLAASIVIVSTLFAVTAHAEKSRVLVLPLPASSAVDADVARAFDARLLVALEETGTLATVTPSDEPECTTLACLAELGTTTDTKFVLSVSVLRETDGLTLFATLIESRTAAASRRAELSGLGASDLARTAPADLARRIAGAPASVGGGVLGVVRPASGTPRAAANAVTSRLAALRTFTVLALDGKADRSSLTHRAELSVGELAIRKQRHHVRRYLDGVMVATLAITDLSDGRVVFTRTVKVTASRRARYSSTAEVTALLVEAAVADWMTAFHGADVETRLKGGS
jgi:hypothetical protein